MSSNSIVTVGKRALPEALVLLVCVMLVGWCSSRTSGTLQIENASSLGELGVEVTMETFNLYSGKLPQRGGATVLLAPGASTRVVLKYTARDGVVHTSMATAGIPSWSGRARAIITDGGVRWDGALKRIE